MIEPLHEDFWNYVKSLQAKGYTVAMHGYEHVFCSPHRGMVTNRIGSEFAGLSLEQQIEKIKKGKEILLKQKCCLPLPTLMTITHLGHWQFVVSNI